VKVIMQWEHKWRWLYNENTSEGDSTMRVQVKVIVQWEYKWQWLYSENTSESGYTMRVQG
jgi:hypothetical protein